MFHKLAEVEAHFQDLEVRLNSPDSAKDPYQFQKLSKEHSNLIPLVEAYRLYRRATEAFAQNEQMIREDSGELKQMALEDNVSLTQEIKELTQKIKVLLLPKDPNDDKNIMVEIRPAAGGDEAGIFVADLFKMYSKFSEKNNWSVELMEATPSDVGGFKEVIMMVRGNKVYSQMKFESGVHRVQRVPKTETQGRIHTSTVTVAVLPEAEDVEVTIDPNDLRIDVFRSSGPGGQSVNTTDSAVRITHLPTNMVVICRDEKSQIKNKSKALKVLKTRLLDQKVQAQHDQIAQERLSQVGTGDRSEKIRTYNYPQGRITDHRVGVTVHQLDAFMGGDIGSLITALSAHYETEALKAQTSG